MTMYIRKYRHSREDSLCQKLAGHFRPAAYRFGKRGAVVAGAYLALICGVAVFVAVTYLLPHEDANLAGVWLILATAPTGFLTLLLPAPDSGGAAIAVLVLAGLFQTYLVWLISRGKPVAQGGGPR